MTSWLNPYRWLLYGGLIAALLLGYVAWSEHIGNVREVAVRSTYIKEALAVAQAARIQETQWQAQLQKAQNDATTRQTKLAQDAAAARTAAERLRNDLATARSRLSQATQPTLVEYADASAELLTDCSRRYQDLAAKADSHAIDALMLQNAWPTTSKLSTKALNEY